MEWPRCPGDGGGCDDVSPVPVHVHVIYVVMCYDVMGQSSLFHRSALAGALFFEPTSLTRGKGLLSGWLYVFERELRWRWRGWWCWNEGG
jgi:hypothetical protein